MSSLRRNVVEADNKNSTPSEGLSLQGSHINLSTRLSNFNVSNPLHYLYNENADVPLRGRPMSASTLGVTYQESPRRSKLAKRPLSADTINKITANNRHLLFDFNNQNNNTNSRYRADLESTFDELEAAEQLSSSGGRSTPVRDDDDDIPELCGGGGGGDFEDGRPTLEPPGLTSKPPIPPVGHAQQSDDQFELGGREPAVNSGGAVTFDDTVELKFQRWFPHSASSATVVTRAPAAVAVDAPSHEHADSCGQRAIDGGDRPATEEQLDEEHLYSNLSAAIGARDKRLGSRASVSVDLSADAPRDEDLTGRAVKFKKRRPPPKKAVPAAVAAHGAGRDVPPRLKQPSESKNLLKTAPKSVLKPTPTGVHTEFKEIPKNKQKTDKEVAQNEQSSAKEITKRPENGKKADDSPVDYVKEDVVSWMSSHQRPVTPELNDNFGTFSEENHKTSTYEEIVNILKELESENDDIDMNVSKSGVTDNNKHQILLPESSYSSKALWSFLDEVEKSSNRSSPSKSPKRKSPVNIPMTPPSSPGNKVTDMKKGNLQKNIELSRAELAQKVATLQLQLAEKEDVTEKLKITVSELKAEHAKSKAEYESTVTRHQKFIDKLLNEKKELSESCARTVKELTKKMNDALASQEDRHRVELKNAVDKQTASEKVKKDRWVDLKTKKIKEMTIKGIEPELNRMSAAYQEELSELRRIHQSQIEEIEATWHRRMASVRDKMDAEREQAVMAERENARNRLEMEIAELEKSYQEQRKRLLSEVHSERLRQERENDVTLMEKQRSLEQKFEKLVAELQEKFIKKEQEFQTELKSIRESCESEKTKWIQHQTAVLAEKEINIKELYKKERDKHIDLVIQKLENEASDREKSSEAKIKRIKSEYESDIRELENTISGHRLKLNEARTKAQEYEDKIAELTSEVNKCHVEQQRLQETVSKLKEDLTAKENIIKNKTDTKVVLLKTELNQSRLDFETKIRAIENEKEKEISRVYVRVKEAIKRKDETIQTLQSERDAALDQCSNLERLLERQRKDLLKLK